MKGCGRELYDRPRRPTRREFVQGVATAAVGLLAAGGAQSQESRPLPTIALGTFRVTRFIAGCNPVLGNSHFNALTSALMEEYYTDERVVQFLLNCEKAGINAWQTGAIPRTLRLMDMARDAGCKLHWIPVADPWENSSSKYKISSEAAVLQTVQLLVKKKPIAIGHHGELSDVLYRDGKLERIRTFLNAVHDLGFLAGVSTHNPAVIEAVEEKGWPADFYMACFYFRSRTTEEFVKEIGTEQVGETYLASDPPRMCKVIRQVPKPCLGFKFLAAGRRCGTAKQVREAFEFAYHNIKPTDAVIAGMYNKFSDQLAEDVGLARELCA